MESDEYFDFILDTFNYYLRKITKNTGYEYKVRKGDGKILKNFLEYVKKTVNSTGKDFIAKFMEFNFNHYFRQDHIGKTNHGWYKLCFSWILGKKAIQRYDKHCTTIFHKINGNRLKQKLAKEVIDGDMFNSPTVEKKDKNSKYLRLRQVEEMFKKKYHNKPEGLIFCSQTTSLFNHNSDKCSSCKFTNDCKSLLKDNYKNLYKARGYEDINK